MAAQIQEQEQEQEGQQQEQPGEEQQQQQQQHQQQQQQQRQPQSSSDQVNSLVKKNQHGEILQGRTKQEQTKIENAQKQQRRDEGLQTNRSRSSSRRERRKRIRQGMDDGKYMRTNSLAALEEADASGEMARMHMFERIGPDSTSMDGPVTYARAMRGEIPLRGSDPNQPKYMPKEEQQQSDLKDTEGLKLTLEANLDIEIELKASIRGDLTLSLYSLSMPDEPEEPQVVCWRLHPENNCLQRITHNTHHTDSFTVGDSAIPKAFQWLTHLSLHE